MSPKHSKPGGGKPPHSQPNQAGAQHDSKCDVSGSIQVTGGIETTIPARLEKKKDAAEKERESRDKLRLGVEIAGLAIVIIYAGLTAWQARESSKAATAAKNAVDQSAKQFVLDQRPFVWLTATGTGAPDYFLFPNNPSHQGQIVWTYHYSDYGKTFAKDVVTISREFRMGKNSQFVASHLFAPGNGTGTPLPPGKDDFGTAVSEAISRDEFQKLMSEDDAIAIRVKMRYSDTSGNTYETGICLTHLALGATKYCDTDNYMK